MAKKDNKNKNVKENETASLILGIIAISISIVPILNIVSFALASISIILGIIVIKEVKSKKVIVGIILSIISVIIASFIITALSLNNENVTNDKYDNIKDTSDIQEKKEDLKENTTEEKEIELSVPDFSTIGRSEAESLCISSKLTCDFKGEYNDSVSIGGFIRQSIPANTTIKNTDIVEIVYSLGHKETTGERNAVQKAKEYLRVMAFSYSGLIEQLKYEGYTDAEATYGVNHCGADWNEQAAKKAKEYLNVMPFSRDGLIEQLEYEGFTYEQAVYGVSQNGY